MRPVFKAVSKGALDQMGTGTIKWKFNAPLSPWWGGWWERKVYKVRAQEILGETTCVKSGIGNNLT